MELYRFHREYNAHRRWIGAYTSSSSRRDVKMRNGKTRACIRCAEVSEIFAFNWNKRHARQEDAIWNFFSSLLCPVGDPDRPYSRIFGGGGRAATGGRRGPLTPTRSSHFPVKYPFLLARTGMTRKIDRCPFLFALRQCGPSHRTDISTTSTP